MTSSQWSDLKLPIRLYEILMRKLNAKEPSNTNLFSKEEDSKIEEMHSPKVPAIVIKALENLYLQPNNEFEAIELDQDVKAVTSEETEIKLEHYLHEVEDFEQALHILNLKGEKEGIKFKKGVINYWKNKTENGIKYRSIICSCKSRHNSTIKKNKDNDAKGSLKKEQAEKAEAGSCASYYRFKFEEKTSKISGLVRFSECHSGHEFKLKKTELSEEMKKDIENFNRNDSVTVIQEFLEKKYKAELSYKAVYHEFRRKFPLFGPADAEVFIKLVDISISCACM